jgi:hypothetical protein
MNYFRWLCTWLYVDVFLKNDFCVILLNVCEFFFFFFF